MACARPGSASSGAGIWTFIREKSPIVPSSSDLRHHQA
jgi:hypothetical protein